MKTALQDAGKRHLAALMARYPARITIAGSTKDGAAVEHRGEIEDAKGGYKQGYTVKITVPFASFSEATLITSATNRDKRQSVTVNGGTGSRTYRIMNVTHDTHRTQWSITAAESVN